MSNSLLQGKRALISSGFAVARGRASGNYTQALWRVD